MMVQSAVVQIDGIKYDLNKSKNTAAVASGEYSGEIIIPSQVTYQGIIYEVTEIKSSAFARTQITKVTLPSSINTINGWAFEDCTSLNTITFCGYPTINNYAFEGCSGLARVYYGGTMEGWCTIHFTSSESNPMYHATELYINNVCVSKGTLTIPDGVTSVGNYTFYNFKRITDVKFPSNSLLSIGNSAFENCVNLTSVTIPNSVTSMKRYAFQNCSKLSNAILGTGLKTIEAGCFWRCSSLTNIQIPNSITSIENDVFRECTSLENIVIPNSVLTLGDQAFESCSKLQNVTLSTNLKQINSEVFISCIALQSILIPNGVKSIGQSAFKSCKALQTITLPNTLETINPSAFSGCFALHTIDMGTGLISIKEDAFSSCGQLTNVTVRATTPPTIESSTFPKNSSMVVKVPCKSLDTYKEELYWQDLNLEGFGDDCSGTTKKYTVSVSSNNTSMGTVSGGGTYENGSLVTLTAAPKSGYKFTKWSDGTTKNPYTFTVTKNVTLTAYFEKESSSSTNEITCEEAAAIAVSLPHNTPTTETYTVIGYVTETDGVVSRNQQIFWMADTPNGGNVFQSYWGNVTEAVAVGDKVSLTGQIMRYNSTYEIKNGDVVILSYGYSPQTYTVSVSSANTSMGTVSGSGEYEEGERATVTATPKSGYRFTKWSDGTIKNPYTFTVTKDVSLTAYFEKESSTPYEITCEEAAAIAAELEHNTPTEETYTVIGYVTETDGVISREQQRFWMADTPNGGNVFQSYWGNVTEALAVGDKVSLTGQIMRYNSTYQIKNGDVVLLQRESQDLFWNFSNSIFNSLGTISTTKIINGLTINATSSGTVVIDASAQTIDNISFTHRLKLNGTGSANYRSLKFNIAGDCTIDIYLKSANSSESRTLRIDYGAFNSSNNQSISATSSIAKRTISYTGNATTVYVYGTNGGVNLYGIRINYNSSTPPDDPTKITCSEAADIAADLDHNSPTNETYTVVGYVTETNGYVTDQSRQVFWMADTKNGGQVFQSYYGNVTEAVQVGDYVSLTGQIKRYNTTPQIQHGDVTILSQETGVDDVVIHKTFDKILRDGQLLIIRDDKTYNVMGQEL